MSSIDRVVARGSSKTIAAMTLPPPAQLPLALQGSPRIMPRKVGKSRDVLIAGNRYDFWYINHDGWLFRYKILHNGSRQILDFILPGEIFGLQACVFKNSLYSVATITQVSLSVIPFDMIDEVLKQSPQLSKALLWSAICEAARLGEHVTDAGRRSAYERLSHLFLELFIRSKRAGLTKDISFHAPLTQELIGDALGLTTIHVNRTLRSLREDKLIAIDGKQVTILDFEALSLMCDFENSYLGEDARTLWNM
jgi:CRP-like cAMP-binding protein